jgi:twinkle protein
MSGDGNFVRHMPCPACGSSDGLAVYDDGHGFCFPCDTHFKSVDGVDALPSEHKRKTKMAGLLDKGEWSELKKRGITQETCRKWDYTKSTLSGATIQIANYYDPQGNEVVAQKVRFPDKTFRVFGDLKKAGLYGQHLWRNHGKMVVVTEGEIDALTVSQLQGNKWPVVSVPNGAQGAKKALAEQLEWLEKFESVILMFDMDEPGRAAAEECAQLFSPGKCKIARLEGGKDANELLQKDLGSTVVDAIWGAKTWEPDGVVNGMDLWSEINKQTEWGLPYPWESVTNATFGIRPNELIVLGAGTGMGKTEFYKEIAADLLVNQKQTIGMLFLEEAPRDTVVAIMSKQASKPMHIPDTPVTPEEKKAAFDATMGTGRMFLYDSFGYTDYDVIKSRIRYMAVACGCKILFLDHITALVSGSTGDERRELDRIMTDLASLVRELRITLFCISHLATPEGKPHEEGGRVMIKHFRGSRAIGQWASYMFGLERDQQADDESRRHVTTFRILKDRYTGRATGFTTHFGYDQETGRLYEMPENQFEDEEDDKSGGDF